MPLTADVDGTLVCAPLLDQKSWRALRGCDIRLTPCGHRGFPRVSPLGTQHFVHEKLCAQHRPESIEHLHAKAVVLAAAGAANWQAAAEVAGEGFIADVLARHDHASVALEIQRSRQTLREYQRRQDIYARAGIRCVWFVKQIPAGYEIQEGLPIFTVTHWTGEPIAVVAGRSVSLRALVGALLDGDCSWRESIPSARIVSDSLRIMCPACGQCREVEVARWLLGTCHCGLPVQRPGEVNRPARGESCCGYWGPGWPLDGRSRNWRANTKVNAGHWCLGKT
jgi:Competence protein CoiA-like family